VDLDTRIILTVDQYLAAELAADRAGDALELAKRAERDAHSRFQDVQIRLRELEPPGTGQAVILSRDNTAYLVHWPPGVDRVSIRRVPVLGFAMSNPGEDT